MGEAAPGEVRALTAGNKEQYSTKIKEGHKGFGSGGRQNPISTRCSSISCCLLISSVLRKRAATRSYRGLTKM